MHPHQPTQWHHTTPQWPGWPTPPGNEPLFQVRVVKHTGLLMMWQQQSYTVSGPYARCEAAIRQAQQHNLAAGWWSPMSLLVLNWVALLMNHSARTALRRQVAHTYAAYQGAHYGQPPAGQPTVSTHRWQP